MTQSTKAIKGGSITEVISAELTNINSNISAIQTTVSAATTPKISSITYSGDDTAADPAGGQTITINGSGFASGATVLIDNQAVSVVTVVSATSIAFTSPALVAGSYILYVVNTDGGTGIAVPGIQYSGTPAWTTAAGSLGSQYETSAFNKTIAATGDAPVTYTLLSGTLPTGATLNANGTISGTSVLGSGSPTTYTFTIVASDAQNQDTNRQFSITIDPDVVSWSSPANAAVITSYEYSNISNITLSATSAIDGSNVSYSANSLPSGISLSGSTISGMSNTVANTSVLITATGNTTTRTSSETIYFDVLQDAVTWNSPSEGATITLDGTAYSNALSATSAAGKTISYSANSLPTGLSLSDDTISGTPTTAGNSATLLTATASTTNRSATRTINWVINLGDTFWKYTTLLLSGSTPTTTFINDASLNNNQLTIAGDTRPNNFDPYSQGYYSIQLDVATADYFTLPAVAGSFNTTAWTFECWLYLTSNGITGAGTGLFSGGFSLRVVSRTLALYTDTPSLVWTDTSAMNLNQWYHIVVTRDDSRNVAVFKNGVKGYNAGPDNYGYGSNSTLKIGSTGGTLTLTGYISNIRAVLGYAVYNPLAASITVPTSPLTVIPGTICLFANSNRFIETSANHSVAITSGSPKIQPFNPFATPATVAYNTQYSTYFDGSGDYFTLPNNQSQFTMGTGDFTVEMWVNISSLSSQRALYDTMNSGDTSGAGRFAMQVTTGGVVQVFTTAGTILTSGGTLSINTWYHIAYVRISNSGKLYVNGIQVNSTYTDNNNYVVGTSTRPVVGVNGYDSSSYPMIGYISNLRVVKNVGVYTGTFTPSTANLTAIQSAGTNIAAIAGTSTSLLTCQDSTLKDNSTNNFLITSSNQVQPTAVSPFTITTGNTTVTSLGSAYFDGAGDYLSLSSAIVPATGNFTIEFWIYSLTKAGSAQRAVYAQWVTAQSGRFMFGLDQSASSRIWLHYNGTDYVGTTGGIIPNTWAHLALVRNGDVFNMYVNGVLNATNTFAGALIYQVAGSIGSAGGNFYPLAQVNDLRIVVGTALYTSNFLPPQAPLTPVTNTRLLTLQHNGGANNNGFVDQSGFNNIITRNGNATQGTFSPFSQTGWSNYFNGSSYLSYNWATGTITTNLTVEGWIYQTDTGTNLRIMSYAIDVYVNAGKLYWALLGSTDAVITTNTWIHFAWTLLNGVRTLYINGTSVPLTGTNDGTFSMLGSSVYIGQHTSGANYGWKGYISNIRVTKDIVYSSNFTPSSTPLTAINGTYMLACQSNRFIDNASTNFTVTPSGTPSIQAFSPFGGVTSVPTSYSNYFDGTGDYLTNTTLPGLGSGDFTVECWCYLVTYQNGKVVFSIGDSASSPNTSVCLYLGATAWSLNCGIPGSTLFANTTAAPFATYPALNNWVHHAIVRSGSTITWYINGVSVYSNSSSSGNMSFTGCVIGYSPNVTGVAWLGYISNLRVVTGTALYTSNFTPSTTPLTAVSGTSLLTCQSATMIDNSTNYFAITATGDVKPRPFNPFGTTTTTSVSYTPSVNGGSMYFDGTGDYLTLPASTNYDLTGDFTIEGWVYPTTLLGSSWGFVDARVSGATAAPWAIGLDNISSQYKLNFFTGTSYTGSINIPLNAWTHIAVTRTGSALASFVNGTRDYYNASYGTGAISPSTTSPRIGTKDNGIGGYETAGYISDLRFINGTSLYINSFVPPISPVTPTNSTALLLNGTSGGIIDAHSTNNLETVGNTQLASEDPYSGSYYSLALASSGYLTTPANAAFDLATASASFTIEAWVYFNSYNSMASSAAVIAGNFQSSNGWFWGWYGVNTISYLTLTVYPSGTAANFTMDASVISLGKWHHIATVNNAGTLTTYINGVSVGGTQSYAGYTGSGGQLAIGVYQQNLGYAGNPDWLISNVRITNGQALYTGSFTPSTIPLTTTSQSATASNVSLLACQSNTFKDNSTNNFTLTRNTAGSIKSKNPFQQNTGKSLYFDGTSNALLFSGSSVPSGAGSAFTFEFWIYPTTLSFVLLRSNGNGSSLGISTNGSGQIVLSNTFTADFLTATGAALTLNAWNHVAITRTTANLYAVYLNGISVGSATYTTSIGVQPMYIGYNTYSGAYYNYYIKDLRITKGVVRYTTTFTPNATPMMAK